MKMIILLLAFSTCADAAPWIVYGQTRMQSGVDDPAPNVTGIIGEVASLPYRVPAGKVLRIDMMAIESHHYQGAQPAIVIFPWISNYADPGTPEIRAASAFVSCAADTHTNSCPMRYYVPAGKYLHVRILASPAPMLGLLMGWHLWGELIDQ